MYTSPLTFEDCPHAAHLHQNTFFKGWSEKDFLEFLENPLIHGLKIEEKDELIGYILWREVGDEAEILTLVVAPSYQRMGRGTLLLTSLFEILVNKGIQKIFLEVAEDHDKTQSFYKKHGFFLLNKRPNYYARKESLYVSALIFLKKLL